MYQTFFLADLLLLLSPTLRALFAQVEEKYRSTILGATPTNAKLGEEKDKIGATSAVFLHEKPDEIVDKPVNLRQLLTLKHLLNAVHCQIDIHFDFLHLDE